ncbi:MAG TPA: hypothetical protein VLM75_06200 [Spirochaetota bacterium]|nr:hypothetical protein [Spirochaetota bacterium]
MPVRDDSIFSPAQKKMLEKTSEALDYGFGFDDEIEIDYIHSHSFSETNMPAREKALAAALQDFSPDDILEFYKKLYRLGAMMRHRMSAYEIERDWKQYTYVKNYLIPPLDTFTGHIRKQLLAKNPLIEPRLPKLHASIEEAVAEYYYELEMEVLRDQWRL